MTMAQLWGGRFTKQTDQLVFDFNASITFDKSSHKKAYFLNMNIYSYCMNSSGKSVFCSGK